MGRSCSFVLNVMLIVERFINELMSSNCYLVYDEITKRCILIDPASEQSLREIAYIEQNGLILDYIILTHEHTDHTWGVNTLIDKYPGLQVVCSSECANALPKAGRYYFQMYFERNDYEYHVRRVDKEINDDAEMEWGKHTVRFIHTPGHSAGSMCIEIDGMLFTGDTIMPFKPYLNKRDSSIEKCQESLLKIQSMYSSDTIVYPGHGEQGTLNKMMKFVKI